MISLYLLTAHLVGDFPLQPDWMAAQKAESPVVRAVHVLTYSVPFLPLLALTDGVTALTFVVSSAIVHYGIDSRRWVEPKDHWSPPEMWVWLIDQIMHLCTLTVLGVALYGL